MADQNNMKQGDIVIGVGGDFSYPALIRRVIDPGYFEIKNVGNRVAEQLRPASRRERLNYHWQQFLGFFRRLA